VFWPNWGPCVADKCELHCTILEAQTIITGLDPFGAVNGGWLIVSGAIIRVEPSWVGNQRSSRYPWSLYSKSKEIANASLDRENVERAIDLKENEYWALLVVRCRGQNPKESIPRGLVLQKTRKLRDDGFVEFRRVGTFKVFSNTSPNKEDALSAWEISRMQSVVII
jgi:hypothetical protein